jgi:hypothetical protein
MDPIDILVNLSGRSQENCLQMYEIAGYDLDLAAAYLLEEPALPAEDLDLKELSLNTPVNPPSTLTQTGHADYYQELLQAELSRSDDPTGDLKLSEISARFQEENHIYKLLIPQYRLEELLQRVGIPSTVQFHPIWVCDNIVPIPGGITICEISSEKLEEIESVVSLFAAQLSRYEMTHCFILDSITKRENRQIFIQQMGQLLPNLFGLSPQDLHTDFHEQVT